MNVRRAGDLAALALLGLAPPLSGLKRGLVVPGLRISEVLVLVLCPVVVLAYVRDRRRLCALDAAAIAYAGANLALGSLDLWRRGDPFDSDAVQTLLGPFQFVALYAAVSLALRTPALRRSGLAVLVATSAPVAAAAILQRLDVPGVRDALSRGTGAGGTFQRFALVEGATRATGPFDHPHTIGAYLALVLIVAAALIVTGVERARPWLVAAAGLDAVALVLTATATPIGVCAIAIGCLSARSAHARRLALGAGGAMLVTLALLYRTIERRIRNQFEGSGAGIVPKTLSFRYDVWRHDYIPVIRDGWNVAVGFGPGIPDSVAYPSTESLYITLLMRGGLILLALFVVLMIVMALVGLRARRRGGPDAAVGLALVVAILALIPLDAIEQLFVDVGSPHVLWGLAGLAVAAGANAQALPED